MTELKKHAPWFFVCGIAFGAAVICLGLAGWYHSNQVDALRESHKQQISTMQARHTRESNKLEREVIDRLDRLERLITLPNGHISNERNRTQSDK